MQEAREWTYQHPVLHGILGGIDKKPGYVGNQIGNKWFHKLTLNLNSSPSLVNPEHLLSHCAPDLLPGEDDAVACTMYMCSANRDAMRTYPECNTFHQTPLHHLNVHLSFQHLPKEGGFKQLFLLLSPAQCVFLCSCLQPHLNVHGILLKIHLLPLLYNTYVFVLNSCLTWSKNLE